MSLQLNTIYNEDCLETMKRMPDNYLHAIVTDPPYGLSFMGKAWDYDVPKVEIWREALRVLKPGGHLLAFAGSRTYHRMAVAIEDAGFEIRDQLIWMYGQGFPKSLNIGKAVDKIQGNEREVTTGTTDCSDFPEPCKGHGDNNGRYGETVHALPTKGTSEWEGYGTALKPAHEPCVLARKPIDGTVANNVLKHGTGGLNIDGCRVKTDEQLNYGTGKKSNVGFKTSPQNNDRPVYDGSGRFPANLIHDGSDEVEAVFPQTGGGKMTIGGTPRKTDGFIATGSPDRSEALMNYGDSGSASRYFKTCKDAPKHAILKVCIKSGTAQLAEKDLVTMSLTEKVSVMYSALKSATQTTGSLDRNLNALSVAKSASSTEISFVQKLVATLIDGTTEFIGEQAEMQAWLKRLAQEQLLNILIELNNLAWYVENRMEELTATIQTISNLKTLYGYVKPTTSKSTQARYYYTSKASKRERGAGNNHPTVKPLALMKYLVKLVAPPKNGIIYDPFSGSGTTLLACQKLGIDFIGSEISKEYCDIAEERLRHFGGDKREE